MAGPAQARSLDHAPCGLFTFDESGIIEFANARLHRLVGAEAGTLVGKPVDSLLTTASRLYFGTHFFPVLRIRGEIHETYLQLQHADGRPVAALINGSTERRPGAPPLFDCAVMARGERDQLESALMQAKKAAEEATRSKDLFLALVAHELRAPLTAILGWSEIGLSPKADAAKKQRAFEVILKSAVAQGQLIEDLLDISRIVSGTMRLDLKMTDLATVVLAAVEASVTIAERRSVQVVFDAEPGTPAVLVDPDRLRQVVWNLLSNAIKFTPKDGKVTLALRTVGTSLVLSVTDTGEGLSAEQIPRLFDRFWQADRTSGKSGGLGLGLSICQKIMELHDGTISAESPGPQQGSVFRIRVPLPVISS